MSGAVVYCSAVWLSHLGAQENQSMPSKFFFPMLPGSSLKSKCNMQEMYGRMTHDGCSGTKLSGRRKL